MFFPDGHCARLGGFHKLRKQFWGKEVQKRATFAYYYYYLGGVKKGQKCAYVVYESSLMNMGTDLTFYFNPNAVLQTNGGV